MGLLMQSDFARFAKSDGIKSDLGIRWPKSSDFGPKIQRLEILAQNPTTRPIGLSNQKRASAFNQVKI